MPNWKDWGAVPEAERTQLQNWADEFEAETGSQFHITAAELLSMANLGIVSQVDFGQWMFSNAPKSAQAIFQKMPWAEFGLTKDSYEQLATTYSTTYEKITGQTISAAALAAAFQTPNLLASGMFSGAQYEQQLMHDANIQKQFGWVKYGLDFSQWQQQKLQLHTAFGRDINDAEAATILQYTHASQGPNFSVIGSRSGGQGGGGQQSQGAGVAGSVVR